MRDASAYSLHYFDGDYDSKYGTNELLVYSESGLETPNIRDLYNGNIKEMYTANTDITGTFAGTNHTWYSYDQLNRIKTMDNEVFNRLGNIDYISPNAHAGTYAYDKNGNITGLTRKLGGGMYDDFVYVYTPGKN